MDSYLDDIVGQLRGNDCGDAACGRTCMRAADEIERLQGLLADSGMTVAEIMADNERLRARHGRTTSTSTVFGISEVK